MKALKSRLAVGFRSESGGVFPRPDGALITWNGRRNNKQKRVCLCALRSAQMSIKRMVG